MHTWQTAELKKYLKYFNKILVINNFKIKILKILVKNNCSQKIRNSRFSCLLFHFLNIQTSKNIYKIMINSDTPTQSTNKTQKKKYIFSNYGLKILQHNHSLFFQSYNHSSLSFHIFLSLSSLSDLLSLSDRRGLKIDINSMDWRSTVIAWWFGDRQQRRGGLERWRRWILFL